MGFLPGPPGTLAAKSPTPLMVPRPPTAELGLKLGQLPVHLPTKSPKCFTRENDRSIDQPIRPPRRPTPQFLHSSQSSQRRTKPRCQKPSDQAFFALKPPGAMPFSIGYRRKRPVVPRIYAIPLLQGVDITRFGVFCLTCPALHGPKFLVTFETRRTSDPVATLLTGRRAAKFRQSVPFRSTCKQERRSFLEKKPQSSELVRHPLQFRSLFPFWANSAALPSRRQQLTFRIDYQPASFRTVKSDPSGNLEGGTCGGYARAIPTRGFIGTISHPGASRPPTPEPCRPGTARFNTDKLVARPLGTAPSM